jgi:hypothetical protein
MNEFSNTRKHGSIVVIPLDALKLMGIMKKRGLISWKAQSAG